LPDTATPLGLVIVDGFDPERDWLSLDAVLAVIEQEPSAHVVWCGWPRQNRQLHQETEALIRSGKLITSTARLSALIADLEAQGQLADLAEPISSEPRTISFVGDKSFSPFAGNANPSGGGGLDCR
jgi:hypothetical protein